MNHLEIWFRSLAQDLYGGKSRRGAIRGGHKADFSQTLVRRKRHRPRLCFSRTVFAACRHETALASVGAGRAVIIYSGTMSKVVKPSEPACAGSSRPRSLFFRPRDLALAPSSSGGPLLSRQVARRPRISRARCYPKSRLPSAPYCHVTTVAVDKTRLANKRLHIEVNWLASVRLNSSCAKRIVGAKHLA